MGARPHAPSTAPATIFCDSVGGPVFQDNCKDADLVEDVVCVALECESEAKALLAAAEAAAPDL